MGRTWESTSNIPRVTESLSAHHSRRCLNVPDVTGWWVVGGRGMVIERLRPVSSSGNPPFFLRIEGCNRSPAWPATRSGSDYTSGSSTSLFTPPASLPHAPHSKPTPPPFQRQTLYQHSARGNTGRVPAYSMNAHARIADSQIHVNV